MDSLNSFRAQVIWRWYDRCSYRDKTRKTASRGRGSESALVLTADYGAVTKGSATTYAFFSSC